MNEYQNVHSRLISFFSGKSSPEEKEQINKWLSESEENRTLFNDLKSIWDNNSATNVAEYDVDHAIQRFRQKIRNKKEAQTRKLRILKVLQYAAVILIILSLPVVYLLGLNRAGADNSSTTITCAYGDKTSIVLPDNSKVYLNSGSTLTFNNNFKREGRNITLEGEAFFSVTKDKKHPFRVKTADVDIEVLGTEFNLKAYPEEGFVSTTLVEGSLRIESETQQTLIKPNEKIVYSKGTKEMTLFELPDTAPETDWMNGRMVFRNETLAELQLKLERWYDVDIKFADEQIKQLRFTGILQRESILEALIYFNYSPYLDYRINGNTITFLSTK